MQSALVCDSFPWTLLSPLFWQERKFFNACHSVSPVCGKESSAKENRRKSMCEALQSSLELRTERNKWGEKCHWWQRSSFCGFQPGLLGGTFSLLRGMDLEHFKPKFSLKDDTVRQENWIFPVRVFCFKWQKKWNGWAKPVLTKIYFSAIDTWSPWLSRGYQDSESPHCFFL